MSAFVQTANKVDQVPLAAAEKLCRTDLKYAQVERWLKSSISSSFDQGFVVQALAVGILNLAFAVLKQNNSVSYPLTFLRFANRNPRLLADFNLGTHVAQIIAHNVP